MPALASPGVEVTIIDQSQYLPGAGPSIPFIMIATAANKKNPNGAGLAQGTVPANAGKLFQVTSQRDLTTLYGMPTFYTTSDGTPIQGGELNEYGLLAAYSVLGATTNAYVLRADIDLASLAGQTGRPTGAPADGTYWLDTTNSTWGIYEWSATTQTFKYKKPIVITSSTQMSGTSPLPSIGNPGDYAVIEISATANNPAVAQKTFYHKSPSNTWNVVGSGSWMQYNPTVSGSSNPTLPIGANLDIELSNGVSFSVTTTAATVASLAGLINGVNIAGMYAAKNTSGGLDLFSVQVYDQETNSTPNYLTVKDTSSSALLLALGITAGTYYQPQVKFSTGAGQPLWQSGQTYPAPTGSVWFRLGSTANGMNPVVKAYNATTGTWITKNCPQATADWVANEALDATGGQAIPAGDVYAQYNYDGDMYNSPLYIWKRAATGPTVITGINNNPQFKNGPYTASVYVSTPGSTTLAGPYTISLADNTTATDFVTAWSAAAIDYTVASVNSDGAIVLTHQTGGEIVLNDFIDNESSGLFKEAGFIQYTGASPTTVPDGSLVPGTFYTITFVGTSDFTLVGAPTNTVGTTFVATGAGDNTKTGTVATTAGTKGVKPGPSATATITCNTTNVTGSGTGLQVSVSTVNGRVYVDATTIPTPGTGYAVGNIVKVLGGSIGGVSPGNDVQIKIMAVGGGGAVTQVAITSAGAVAPYCYTTQLSNWQFVAYVPNEGAPTTPPADFTNWYWNTATEVDIMVNTGVEDPATGSTWKGYRNVAFDNYGFPKPSGAPATDSNGPIVSATKPSTQSDGVTPLAYGDLWIDVSAAALENYPVISRWQQLKKPDGSPSTESGWVLLDTSDQTSSTGVVFADARWATNGSTNPANDPIPTIKSLLISNYLDIDAPDSALYPVGMLLFNTRRSGYNVKKYRTDYLTAKRFPDMPSPPGYPTETACWVSASGLQNNGAAYMGRKAQRNMVVESLRAGMDSNQQIRDEDNAFNLMATPNYPELQPNMIVLNNDRGQTGFILGDTPLGLPMQATAIQAWANNLANDTSTGENGLVGRSEYMGLFYPSGITAEPSAGKLVVVPPSHMMLRTFIHNDTIAYPWLAAAGVQRGTIDNATNIGYLDRATGEFQPVKTPLGIRNVLYTNQINPLVNFTGLGLLNYGNKTSKATNSALDRVNVARLVAYIRWQLTKAARPFVFEPNDALTRKQIAGVIETLMVDLVAKRGIYDYLVQCDEQNNTPARIDRNELWVDVAIEPVKAAEFIYIPVRILNTGELAQ